MANPKPTTTPLAESPPDPPEVAAFLTHLAKVRDASLHTLRAYGRECRQLVAWLAARGRTLDAARRLDLRAYVATLRQEGLRETSLRRALSALRTLFKFLDERQPGRPNPVAGMRGPRGGRPLPHALTQGEVELLLGLDYGDDFLGHRDRALIRSTRPAAGCPSCSG
jgi:site-specific recombinase XerD